MKKYFEWSFYKHLYNQFKESVLWKRIFKNFSIGISGSGINILLSLAKTVILAKTLSVSNYGLVMITVNFYSFINMILDVKINDLLFRFLPEFQEKADYRAEAGIINLCLLICCLIVVLSIVIILFFSGWIASNFYNNSVIASLLVVYLIAGAFNILRGFSTGILRLKDKFAHIVIPQVIGNLITIVFLLFYFFLIGEKDLKVITGIIASGTLIGIFIPFYYSLKLTINIRNNFRIKESFKSLIEYKGIIKSTIIQTNLASYLNLGSETGGVFLLGVFGSSIQVALYNISFQMVKPIMVLTQNIQPAVYPEIVKFYSEKKYKSLLSLINKITVSNFIVGAFALVLAFFLTEPFIRIFTTPEYVEAIPVFFLILAKLYLGYSTLCFYPLTVVMDKLKRRNIILTLRLLYIPVLILFYEFTALNVALSQILGSFLTRIFHDFPLYKKLKKKKND